MNHAGFLKAEGGKGGTILLKFGYDYLRRRQRCLRPDLEMRNFVKNDGVNRGRWIQCRRPKMLNYFRLSKNRQMRSSDPSISPYSGRHLRACRRPLMPESQGCWSLRCNSKQPIQAIEGGKPQETRRSKWWGCGPMHHWKEDDEYRMSVDHRVRRRKSGPEVSVWGGGGGGVVRGIESSMRA